MDVEIWKGKLEKRDENYDAVRDKNKLVKEFVSLDVYLNRVRMRATAKGEGYQVYEGATITPEPFWKIIVSTTQRKRGELTKYNLNEYQIISIM